MWLGEPITPYYGFYEKNPLTIQRFFISLAVYMFTFDTWFFFTHLFLHHPKLMKMIHYHHHEFVEPTAYG
jgi:Delta7-sterol 5-desaturase